MFSLFDGTKRITLYKQGQFVHTQRRKERKAERHQRNGLNDSETEKDTTRQKH